MTDKPKTKNEPLFQFIELSGTGLVKTKANHNLTLEQAGNLVVESQKQGYAAYSLGQTTRHINPDAETCTRCQRTVVEALYPKPKPTTT